MVLHNIEAVDEEDRPLIYLLYNNGIIVDVDSEDDENEEEEVGETPATTSKTSTTSTSTTTFTSATTVEAAAVTATATAEPSPNSSTMTTTTTATSSTTASCSTSSSSKQHKKIKHRPHKKKQSYHKNSSKRAAQRTHSILEGAVKNFLRGDTPKLIKKGKAKAEKHLNNYLRTSELNEIPKVREPSEKETEGIRHCLNTLDGLPEGFIPDLKISILTIPDSQRIEKSDADEIMKLTVSEKDRRKSTLLNKRDPTELAPPDSNVIIIENEKQELMAMIFREIIPLSLSKQVEQFRNHYESVNTLYNGGCKAVVFPDPEKTMHQLKQVDSMDAAGFKENVTGIVGLRATRTGKNIRLKYKNKKNRQIEWTLSPNLNRKAFEVDSFEDCEFKQLLDYIEKLYEAITWYWIKAFGCGDEHVDNELSKAMENLQIIGNKIDQYLHQMGIHADPSLPFPSIVFGPTTHTWNIDENKWNEPSCDGGKLFFADGWVPLKYGPRDAVFIDGNISHGVTNLKGKPNTMQGGDYTRFSMQLYSTYLRNTHKNKKYGSYNNAIWG